MKKPFGLASFEMVDGKWVLPMKVNPEPHTCSVRHCRRDPRNKGGLCQTCNSRIWRANHPVEYAYGNLKSRAKQRGHEFTITLEEFRKLCEGTGLLANRGRNGHNLSVDRIENHLGYVPGNLRVLTISQNVRARFAPFQGEVTT